MVKEHMVDLDCSMKENKIRRFMVKNQFLKNKGKKIFKGDLGETKGIRYRIQVGPFRSKEEAKKIIDEQKISKREFAKRVGISENYLYVLTGNSRSDSNKNKTISHSDKFTDKKSYKNGCKS